MLMKDSRDVFGCRRDNSILVCGPSTSIGFFRGGYSTKGGVGRGLHDAVCEMGAQVTPEVTGTGCCGGGGGREKAARKRMNCQPKTKNVKSSASTH